jgi:hypothetical protein
MSLLLLFGGKNWVYPYTVLWVDYTSKVANFDFCLLFLFTIAETRFIKGDDLFPFKELLQKTPKNVI